MDSDSSRRDNQGSKSHNHGQSLKPDIMQLQYLKELTNNFSDERILGRGGFGVVYKGVLQNGEMVAIKKLLQPMPNFLKQFKNEIDLLVSLKHPNIVQLIGYCYETQNVHMDYNGKFIFAEVTQCLLCLEFLPKGSLDGYISDESCGLDWGTRYTIIEGICNGLQYLHEQIKPIIHLDLKPANILLTENMVPKVTDFGLSRLLDEHQTMCTLITTGTRGYMPPEYIQGGTITPMSDIFSLGVIILEVITGHRDYPDVTRTSSNDFIELTLKKWSDVLEKAPGFTSLEIDCQQIKTCIQIGLICVNPERTKRPTAAKVIKMLQGLESMDFHGGNEVTSLAAQSRPGPRELLDIYPLELCFSLDPDKPCLVKLTNKTDGYVAFHFKATRTTNKYCIEPSSGFLWPRSPLNVVVRMEERCELPPDLQCLDEFLIQSITVSMERLVSEHITEDTFNRVSSKAVQKTYLQSASVRIEEMRVKRRDTEQWMAYLPENLKERILRHEQYRWQETRGVDEEGLLINLPKDLSREIKRHLCLSLLKKVPTFENMDEQVLDAMCDRLKPTLYTEDSYIIRKRYPVKGMIFVMRGYLESMTTNGGQSGFFNSNFLKRGDFCGEELLTWAIDPAAVSNLPSSTRTVKALSEVEAFVLRADDLKFVATQFRELHSEQFKQIFRFYSLQWRTWAACFIQAAWRRYCRKKAACFIQAAWRRYCRKKLEVGFVGKGKRLQDSRFRGSGLAQ